MTENPYVLSYYIVFVIVGIMIIYSLITKKSIKDLLPKTNSSSSSKKSVTPFLDSYAIDFTKMSSLGTIDPVIGRTDEVKKLSQVLSRRTKNNAILTGAPGVGKTAIVEGLAQRISAGEVPETLKNKRILALDVPGLLAGTKYRGEFEDRAKKIVQEISASNRSIILFIDEVHSIIQSQGSEGSVNFSDILKPALARGDLQMVGATTNDEYNKYIKTDSSLERRFQPIDIPEVSAKEALIVLQGVKDKYREYHKAEFTDASLKAAVDLTKKYIKNRKLPDKAIDAIDEAAAMIRVSHMHVVIPAILYQAAVEKYPETAKIWKQLQELDTQIRTNKTAKQIPKLVEKRESLEADLDKIGVVVVDSDDIEKVIKDWMS